MYKDIFEELAFKFSNLADLKPDHVKTKLDFMNIFLKDETVHNFNPSRYTFYMEFMKGLNNPSLLKNIIYENKLIAASKEEENKIVQDIVDKMNLLYSVSNVTTNKNILKNDQLYLKLKEGLRKKENEVLKKRIKSIVSTYGIEDYDNKPTKNDKDASDIGKEINKLFQDEPEEPPKNSGDISGGNNKKIVRWIGGDQPQPDQTYSDNSNDVGNYPYLAPQDIGSGPNAVQGIDYDPTNAVKYNNGQTDIAVAAAPLAAAVNPQNMQPKQEDNPKKDPEEDKVNSAQEQLKKDIEKDTREVEKAKTNNEEEINRSKKNIKTMRDKYKTNAPLHVFRDKLKFVLDTPSVDSKVKASKLKDIINEIEEDELTSIKHLKIKKEDKLTFIAVTFFVRLLTLNTIDWAINTNFCVNFTQAYVLYLILYSLFLLLIIVVVNITYNYPLFKLYEGDHSWYTTIASMFYYFYFIPGYWRSGLKLIIHFALIFFLTGIAIAIVDKKTDTVTLNYDYDEKKKIRRSLSTFTLILWLFTSLIAMNVS